MRSILFWTVVWVAVFVWVLTAAVYALLAGGGTLVNFLISLGLIMVAAPTLTLCWQFRADNPERKKWFEMGHLIFWTTLCYFCLPILFNVLSLLLHALNFSVLAEFVFLTRYWSLIIILAVGMAIMALTSSWVP